MSVQEEGARPWPAAARSRLVVEIRLDPVPGWGNTPEDHRVLVQRLLEDAVGHYQPTVTIAPVAPHADGVACRCQVVGETRDPYEPHIPAQAEWEQADDCPVHPLPSSLAQRDAEVGARVLREAADELWRVFLRLPHTPSPVGDYVQRRVVDLRARADALAAVAKPEPRLPDPGRGVES
jgi:hypothetical protein